MSTTVTPDDLRDIGTIKYCGNCGEVWDDEDECPECERPLQTRYGFLEGGSHHSPVFFEGFEPGKAYVIVPVVA